MVFYITFKTWDDFNTMYHATVGEDGFSHKIIHSVFFKDVGVAISFEKDKVPWGRTVKAVLHDNVIDIDIVGTISERMYQQAIRFFVEAESVSPPLCGFSSELFT